MASVLHDGGRSLCDQDGERADLQAALPDNGPTDLQWHRRRPYTYPIRVLRGQKNDGRPGATGVVNVFALA